MLNTKMTFLSERFESTMCCTVTEMTSLSTSIIKSKKYPADNLV